YGAPPAPPPGAYGNIPTQRLPTQINQFDTAPSCVQNAMMTKDKKPFTYTPGGIDLSQIKSPRMAKRIARNAQNEGVTGQSRPSPLVKPNGTENGNHYLLCRWEQQRWECRSKYSLPHHLHNLNQRQMVASHHHHLQQICLLLANQQNTFVSRIVV
uniref:Zasp-like motif domain-containing protein n=1 Tax=Megaselia scalaris TaxID=36166 RepID=T1GF49_MEGSC